MKLYREDQKYHDVMAIVMVAVIALLFAFTVITSTPTVGKILLGIIAIGAISFLMLRLRLKIRISRKKLSVRVAPFPWARFRVAKNDVTGVEFISTHDSEIANGWAVTYGGRLRIFNFGDRKGMLIHRADGTDAVIFSKQLFENRKHIMEELRSHGWSLS